MSPSKILFCFLFLIGAFQASKPACLFAGEESIQEVSVGTLLASLGDYDGKIVRVIGYVRMNIGGDSIYDTEEDSLEPKKGLWLEIEDPEVQKYRMNYDGAYIDDNPMKNTSVGVGFAVSADGRTWLKHPVPILTGDGGAGERKGMIIGTGVLYKDEKYYLFYPGADPHWDRFTINLATFQT